MFQTYAHEVCVYRKHNIVEYKVLKLVCLAAFTSQITRKGQTWSKTNACGSN